MGRPLFQLLSMESIAQTKDIETEAVIFAKITNPEGLGEAISKEHHEQLEADLGKTGRCRVRKTTTETDVIYEFTIKTPSAGVGAGVKSVVEKTVRIDEEFYEAFRPMAKKMLRKTRYVFNANLNIGSSVMHDRSTASAGVKYEVDVFETQQGYHSPWAKIDVELDDILRFIREPGSEVRVDKPIRLTFKVSHLAFKPTGWFLVPQATPEQKALLDELWDKHYNLPVDWVNPRGEEASFAGTDQ